MANILYVSYDGMTDNLGQSQVLPYLKGLTNKGHRICLISFEKDENYKRNRTTIEQIVNANNIKWYPLSYTPRPPIVSTIYDIIRLNHLARQIYNQEKIEVVHCRSYIAAFAGLMLKQKYGVKFVFDMRGFWADERVDGKIWNRQNLIFDLVYKYFKKQELKYFKNADYTISLTYTGRDEIWSWKAFDGKKIPIEVIPCCADFEHFIQSEQQAQTTSSLRKEFGFDEKDFILSYLGSIGTWYMLDEMLNFFATLLKHRPEAKFLFITSDNAQGIIEHGMARGIAPEHFVIQRASRQMVPAYIALSSMSIFFIKPVFSKKASSPTKLAEIMAMGKTVICNDGVGDVAKIIDETQSGIVISQFDVASYEHAISRIDATLQTQGSQIRQAAIERFSLSIGVERYNSVYQKILNTK